MGMPLIPCGFDAHETSLPQSVAAVVTSRIRRKLEELETEIGRIGIQVVRLGHSSHHRPGGSSIAGRPGRLRDERMIWRSTLLCFFSLARSRESPSALPRTSSCFDVTLCPYWCP